MNKNISLRYKRAERGFTTSNERQSGSLLTFSARAGVVQAQRGFPSSNEREIENSFSVFANAGAAKHRRGFTLIEMLVAVGIFAIVMVTSMGTLIVLLGGATSAQSTQSVTTNLSYALDRMSRNIRTGYDYRCMAAASITTPPQSSGTGDCTTGATGLIFTDSETNFRTAYRLTSGHIDQYVSASAGWLRLTSEDVSIDDLMFYVTGSTPADAVQPYVRILMRGTPTQGAIDKPTFYMQSTVVQRTIDY